MHTNTYKVKNTNTLEENFQRKNLSLLKLRMQRTQFSYAKTMAETESLIKIHLQAILKCLIEHNYHLIHSLPLICNFLLLWLLLGIRKPKQ
jgi:hypothetical protein